MSNAQTAVCVKLSCKDNLRNITESSRAGEERLATLGNLKQRDLLV